MRRTPRNLAYHELIGLPARVVESLDPSLVGVEGTIVYETMNTLWIRSGERVKKILKRGTTFLITLPEGGKIMVPGDKLVGRPEDRVKRIGRR